MSGPNCWVPRLTLALSGVHALTAIVQYRDVYNDMVSSGIVGSVSGQHDREAATWFFVAAPAVAGLGLVSRWSVKHTGRIPPAVPPTLLGVGALVSALDPASGGWALIGLGIAGMAAGRTREARTASPARAA